MKRELICRPKHKNVVLYKYFVILFLSTHLDIRFLLRFRLFTISKHHFFKIFNANSKRITTDHTNTIKKFNI